MNIGESKSFEIRAHEFWNRTGLLVNPNERFRITAAGDWVDLYLHHGPDGDPSPNFYLRAFEKDRRLPAENWFVLAGAIDANRATVFRIGSLTIYTAAAAGELTCFANDVEGFYWNNWGFVTMTVTREA